ncbi:MAG TPA: hypothetical protein VHN80_14910 [Kineosporiaceae bacterium]|jgi:hypothetical protein|nr:hypothetical protein [Kineosporiaceae bacterium]
MNSPDLSLHPGETVIESWRANRSQGQRAVGGRLHLTTQRLLFVPHVVDSVTGGHRWEVLLSGVSAVDVAPRGWHPFDGSLRRRLRISAEPVVEHFVVPKVDEVAQHIETARHS